MRHRKFNLFPVLAFVLLSAMLSIFSVGAQQKQEAKPAKPGEVKGHNKEEEPVAITPKAAEEKPVEAKTLTPEDFGNFRFPAINSKGEIAFVALYSNPAAQNKSGQSIFVRQPDGTWKITREGEKASNLPEGIYGFSVPNLSNNGDLTFFASFGSSSALKPAAVVVDPNDPVSSGGAVPRNGALYVKTTQGLKSIVKLGEEVPLMPSHFSGFSNASTNSKGVTAFIGTYSDPDGRGLFLAEDGKLRLVIRSGQKVGLTGIPDDSWSEHYYPAPINERGEIAFMQRIGDRSGIFVSRPSGVELIAIGGKPAPVKESNYLGFGNRTPSINSNGEVAFVGFFDGPNAGRGLFFKGSGPTQLIARNGDKAGDAGGEFTDFLTPAVNARGDIAFIGKMAGRAQGIFVKTAKGIETVALLDQKIPGGKGPMEVFNNFTQPAINDKGEIVFYAQTKNAEVGIFHRDEKGVLHTLVRRGEKMPK